MRSGDLRGKCATPEGGEEATARRWRAGSRPQRGSRGRSGSSQPETRLSFVHALLSSSNSTVRS